MTAGCGQPWTAKSKLQLVLCKLCLKKYVILLDHKARPKKFEIPGQPLSGIGAGGLIFSFFL